MALPGFLITVVVALVGTGILLWAVKSLPWIDADMKQLVRVILIVVVALWLLGALVGYAPVFPDFPRRN